MTPFHELFNNADFWSAVIVALIGGGGFGGLVGALASRRKTRAEAEKALAEAEKAEAEANRVNIEADKLAADAARQAADILTTDVIAPLQEHIDRQEKQIEHLEKQQDKYFKAVSYTRRLFHWLQDFCEVVEPDFLQRHPKPSLPDELRPDVAPETLMQHQDQDR